MELDLEFHWSWTWSCSTGAPVGVTFGAAARGTNVTGAPVGEIKGLIVAACKIWNRTWLRIDCEYDEDAFCGSARTQSHEYFAVDDRCTRAAQLGLQLSAVVEPLDVACWTSTMQERETTLTFRFSFLHFHLYPFAANP